MKIKILGTGCSKCKALKERTEQAVKELGLNADIEKVEDLNLILDYNVMCTPALVVEDKVVLEGRLPSAEELKEILKQG
jgi:small redox-active disulfide protein 2